MLFFKQLDDKSCQLVALQTALSYFGKYPSINDIRNKLPKHSFGNLITEIAMYLEVSGIKTTLISNNAKIRSSNRFFKDELNKYALFGNYEDRAFTANDLNNGPIIVNVDWYKIKRTEKGIGAHYIVLLKKDLKLWIFDGSNFGKPVEIDFDFALGISKNINRWKDDGMFLVCRGD